MKPLITLFIAAVLIAGMLTGCHHDGRDDRAPNVPTSMIHVGQ